MALKSAKWGGFALLLVCLAACSSGSPETIVITATFDPWRYTPPPGTPAAELPALPETPTLVVVVPAGEAQNITAANPSEYAVQPGDTLGAIAARFGVSVETLQAVNDLTNPDLIAAGQVLRLPDAPTQAGSAFPLVPDHRLVRGPGSAAFNVGAFAAAQPGYLKSAVDEVNGEILRATTVVERVALEYSVDARLLLALLELKGGWLSNPEPSEYARTYALQAPASPLGFDRNGLYRQLTWAADQLNAGYYGWRAGTLSLFEFEDGTRILPADTLNAGSIGVQYMLTRFATYPGWSQQVSAEGLYAIYTRYFGDPFADFGLVLVPDDLVQPELRLPFPQNEVWFYTGGPHGGWGSGSAWSAVDFAPPDERPEGSSTCYISDYFATAVADGVIARSDEGAVVLDLDGDGDETTGWTIFYLHMADQDRIEDGARVTAGDRIGRPSCEGGFSNGTHLHIARRYNGEWIPAWCGVCRTTYRPPAFVMSGWNVIGLTAQEYQGYLTRGSEQRIAEQGRLVVENRVSW
ncbi:MAG: LysM peptidoglycan-binding domain-containing protein [bacterium]|nr:LysM peptidoglycan-binding domain-containing protein [bacterium]